MGNDTVISTIKQQLAWLTERWDRFFFQPVDSLPLSLLRILCGCMLLYTHVVWGLAFTEFFGSSGWNSPELIAQLRGGGITPSLWWYVPEGWMSPIHWLCNLVILLFTLGLGGRVTAILTWIIAVSYAHRAHLANFGLDQTNCILAFYLIIGPSTQHLSLDRWLAKRRLSVTQPGPLKLPAQSSSANVALRLIQLHLCIIYLWAGLGKLQGEAWWTGEAMWLALANLEYQSMDMTWLANYPRLLELLTHATIFWELSFSALVWPKATRWITLGIGALMHLGIGAFLGMWTFGSIMIFSYVAFASGAWLRNRFGFLSSEEIQAGSSWPTPNQREQPQLNPSGQSPVNRTPLTLPASPVITPASAIAWPLTAGPSAEVPLASSLASGKTIVLITASQRCVDHFLQINRQAQANWVVVHSIEEAEALAHLLPQATFLMLEMRTLNDSGLQYLSIRVVTAKRSTHRPESDSTAKRAFPK